MISLTKTETKHTTKSPIRPKNAPQKTCDKMSTKKYHRILFLFATTSVHGPYP